MAAAVSVHRSRTVALTGTACSCSQWTKLEAGTKPGSKFNTTKFAGLPVMMLGMRSPVYGTVCNVSHLMCITS